MKTPTPPVALASGAILVALFAIATALDVRAIVLDEAVYKIASASYADGPATAVLDDQISRGIARLYSFLVAPLFVLFDGDVGVRLARALNCVLFAATAVPVAALARHVGVSAWGSVAAGLGAIAVPWLSLGTIMFSEALAYLLFAVAVLAMVRALAEPSPRRDAIVVVLLVALVLTRVQFVALLPAWFAVVVFLEHRAGTLRTAWRRFPVLVVGAALTVLAVLVLLAAGALSDRIRGVGGPYADLQDRADFRGNFGLALLYEVGMLSFGVGVIPAVLAGFWMREALGARAGEEARRLAVIAAVAISALFASTLWAQGGWLDLNSEERYFIYAIPLVWVAAVAALERRAPTARGLMAGGVVIAVILALVPIPVPLSGEQLFLGPVAEVLRWGVPGVTDDVNRALGVGGLVSSQDMLALATLGMTLVAAALWRARRHTLALVPAVAVQLVLTGYTFAGLHGQLDGIGGAMSGPAFSSAGWADRAAGGRSIGLADNAVIERDGTLRATIFWNDRVQQLFAIPRRREDQPPAPYPIDALGLRILAAAGDLTLDGLVPGELQVQSVDSPRWQLDAGRRALSPDGRLELVDAAAPRLRWSALELDTDGHVPAVDVALRAAPLTRVELDVQRPAGDGAASMAVSLGGQRRDYDSTRSDRATLRFDLCKSTGPIEGTIVPGTSAPLGDGRAAVARLVAVRVSRCG